MSRDFNASGGWVDEFAVIGDPPEHRDWHPGDSYFQPEIDPSARINSFVTVDGGLNEPTRVGPRVFAMTKTHIAHDCQVGADCELAPGTVLGGHVVLEDGVRCGINVSVRPGIRVGKGARLGAAAVVVKDVPPGAVHIGNPAGPIHEKAGQRSHDLAWAAGLFEGEGCFSYSTSKTNGRVRRRLRASLETTDLDVLERFHEVVGCGGIHDRGVRTNVFPNAKQIWQWYLNGDENVQGLYDLLGEWLGQRRRFRAEELLDEIRPAWRDQTDMLSIDAQAP